MKGFMCGIVKETPGKGLSYKTDLPIPQINSDDILVKVKAAAICGTDLHIYDWDEFARKRMNPPSIVGHEIAGDVVEVGADVKGIKVGDRVSAESHIFCGECFFCKNDMREICSNVETFGVSVDGAFAEYAKIRYDCAFKLADHISYEAGCMFEPMGAGVHGVESAEVNGKTVLISGCGPIGLTAITASKVFGAKTVIACDLFDEKLKIAREMGADIVINSKNSDIVSELKKLTNGLGVDAAIDITGSGKAINAALKSLRAAGRMVCVGLPDGEVAINLAEDLIYRQIEFTGISGRKIWQTWEDFSKVMADPRYNIERIMGPRFAMRDFEKAFEAIRSGVPGKMILYP